MVVALHCNLLQSRGALQRWMLELAPTALVRPGAWLQGCADRGGETFLRVCLKAFFFSHLAAGQSKQTQNIILLNIIAGPSTRGC